ncbi:hypothetical protein ACLKA6_012327 [Drosophila palustris]
MRTYGKRSRKVRCAVGKGGRDAAASINVLCRESENRSRRRDPQSDQSSSRTNEASGTLRDQPNSSRAATMAKTEARGDVGLGRENEVVEEQLANPGPELKEEAELVIAQSLQGKLNEVVEALLRHPLEICAQTVEAEPTCKQIASIAKEPAQLSAYPETDDQPGWNPEYRADYEGNQTERRDQSQQYNLRSRDERLGSRDRGVEKDGRRKLAHLKKRREVSVVRLNRAAGHV